MLDWERDIEQTLVFSVDMVPATADVRKAAASDDLADALDYSAVWPDDRRRGARRQVPADRNRRRAGRRAPPGRLPASAGSASRYASPIKTDGYTAVISIERTREDGRRA